MDLLRHADRRALPAAATARWSSTSWRRASTTRATGRSRAPRRPSSSSTSGRSAGWGSDRTAALRPGGDGQPPRDAGRDARPGCSAWPTRLADPAVHLHLYDKREVFERRKMGHLTALGPDVTQALASAPRGAGQAPAGPTTTTRRRTTDDRGHDARSPRRRRRRRQPLRLPDARGGRRGARRARRRRRSSRSCRRIGRPDRLFRYAEEAAGRGIRVIIAGAGGAAHLPGMLAAKTALPVIGVPIPTEHLGGLDSLLSIVQMPRGVPVATVGIGNATNAGLLAAAILATLGPEPRGAPGRLARPPDPGRPRRPVERRPERRGAQPPSTHGVTAPRIPTSIDHRVEVAVMNSRRPSGPPKVQLLACLGQEDPPELDAVGVEDVDPVAGRRPDVALDVDPESVRDAGLDDREDARRRRAGVRRRRRRP